MAKEKKERLTKKGKGFLSEFKEFAMRGSVIDLAVGVIIGAAFQAIINSMVKDIITPLIGRLFGNVDFSNLFLILGKLPETADASKLTSLSYVRDTLGVAVFAYGSFITAVINFIIMAFAIFLLVKLLNKLRDLSFLHAKKEEEAAPVPTTKTCPYCLSEIPYAAVRCAHCTSQLKVQKEDETAEEIPADSAQ